MTHRARVPYSRPLLPALGAGLLLACGSGTDPLTPPPPPPPLHDRIIFSRSDPWPCAPCRWRVWTAAIDGSDLRLLVDSLNYPTTPRVAPDGQSVVFEDWYSLHVTDAAGQQRLRLVTGLKYNYSPSWTPDGWILFMATDSIVGGWQIFRSRSTGEDREQLTSCSDHFAFDPTLSPDGTQLALIGRSEGSQVARYSPDGQTVPVGSGDLWLADSRGQNPRVLLDDAALYFSASWTPAAAP